MSSNCRINHRCIIFKIEIKENFERFYHGSVNIDGHGSNRSKGPAISFVNLTGEDTRGRVVGIPRPRRLPLANLHHNGKSRGKGWRDTWSFRERGLAPTRTRTYISTLDTRAERVVARLSLSLSSSPRIRTYTDDTRFAAPPIVIYAPLCDHLGRIFLPPPPSPLGREIRER